MRGKVRISEHLQLSLLIANLHRLASSAPSSCIRQQLRMTALLQAHEPEHCLLDSLSASQETVVLQECGFVGSEGARDVVAFLGSEDDAVERLVEDVILSSLT